MSDLDIDGLAKEVHLARENRNALICIRTEQGAALLAAARLAEACVAHHNTGGPLDAPGYEKFVEAERAYRALAEGRGASK